MKNAIFRIDINTPNSIITLLIDIQVTSQLAPNNENIKTIILNAIKFINEIIPPIRLNIVAD